MARTPIHPGEHLAGELKEIRISAAELARQIEVPVNRVTGIINGSARNHRTTPGGQNSVCARERNPPRKFVMDF
jgi:hypothetical protein